MKSPVFFAQGRQALMHWAITALMIILATTASGSAPLHAAATVSDLPLAAQSLISATLGHDNAAYQFQATADGYRVTNLPTALQADFTAAGLHIQTGDAHWALALQAMGYGDALQAVSAVVPTAIANRLEYARGTLIEWFVSGPAGLEQGWTLNSPPRLNREEHGLTLALLLTGQARLDSSGQAVELLRDDGTVAVRYTGLTAYDASGRELRAWLDFPPSPARRGTEDEVYIHIDDTGAQYPVTIDPYLTPVTLTNSGGAANDFFGFAVAISADGSTAVVGAYGVNGYTGAAYVFVKPGGGWATSNTPAAVLTSSGSAGDNFGHSVAINSDGSVIAVGAFQAGSGHGAVYVFIRPGGGWATTGSPDATLTHSSVYYDYLGCSVGINADGSTIVAGAFGAANYIGATYVFVKPGGGWATTNTPTASLTYSGGVGWDQMGSAVAISGDGSTVVSGAYNYPGAFNRGAAYVYVKPGGDWSTTVTPTAILTKTGGLDGDSFGYSVATNSDGSIIVIGAQGVDTAGTHRSKGAAYVFAKPGSGWASTGSPAATLTKPSPANFEYFGSSVGVTAGGATIVAGARGVSSLKGAVYAYAKPGGGWASSSAPGATLTNSSGAASDQFGLSLSISENSGILIVGAQGVSSNTGAAYVFDKNPTAVTLRDLTATANASPDIIGAVFAALVALVSLGAWLLMGRRVKE